MGTPSNNEPPQIRTELEAPFFYTHSGKTHTENLGLIVDAILRGDETYSTEGTWQTIVAGRKVACAEPELVAQAKKFVKTHSTRKRVKIIKDWKSGVGWVYSLDG